MVKTLKGTGVKPAINNIPNQRNRPPFSDSLSL